MCLEVPGPEPSKIFRISLRWALQARDRTKVPVEIEIHSFCSRYHSDLRFSLLDKFQLVGMKGNNKLSINIVLILTTFLELQGTFWRKNELDIFTRLEEEEGTDGQSADFFQQIYERMRSKIYIIHYFRKQ